LELLAERKSTNFSDVARSGNFGFETRLLDGSGRRHVCWAYSMTIIVLPLGVVMVPPQSGKALGENPSSLV